MNDLSDSDRLTGKAATFEADYQAVIGQAPQDFREELFAVIRMHAQSLTDHFYEAMLADPGASPYLSHELVNGRLRRSMVSWLQELFDPSSAPNRISLAQQRSVESSCLPLQDAERLALIADQPIEWVGRQRTLCMRICLSVTAGDTRPRRNAASLMLPYDFRLPTDIPSAPAFAVPMHPTALGRRKAFMLTPNA